MRWMEGREMAGYLCDALQNADWIILYYPLYAPWFSTHAPLLPSARIPVVRPYGLRPGWKTLFAGQCGQCCVSLDYHGELTADDVALWKKLGRDDILEMGAHFKKERWKNGLSNMDYTGYNPSGGCLPILE